MLRIDDAVVVPLRLADTRASRRQGLLDTDSIDGALWITQCPSVHTFGMRYAIDVAFVDRNGVVVDVVPAMRPGRLGWVRFRAADAVEAAAGSFAKWNLAVGSRLVRVHPPVA